MKLKNNANRYHIIEKVTERGSEIRSIEKSESVDSKGVGIPDVIYDVRSAIIVSDYEEILHREKVEIYISLILGVLFGFLVFLVLVS